MKINDKGMFIPNAFVACYSGSREEAMTRFSPGLEGGVFASDLFWQGIPEQRWLGLMLAEEEQALLIKVLAGGSPRTPMEEEFARRVILLMSSAVGDHER